MLDQQILFIEASLKYFNQAKLLDHQIQKWENRISFNFASSFINRWIRQAHLQLKSAYQQKWKIWVSKSCAEALATFLHYCMQKWLHRLNTLQLYQQSLKAPASTILYFRRQAESFISIWKDLQQKEISLNQKHVIEAALGFYSNAIENITAKSISLALDDWKNSMEILASMISQGLKRLELGYEILLMERTLTTSGVKELIQQMKLLKVQEGQEDIVKRMIKYAKLSLKELQAHHFLKFRFFLLRGWGELNALLSDKKLTSPNILEKGLNQAALSLKLFSLSRMLSESTSDQAIHKALKEQQQNIFTQIQSFIPTVLEEQSHSFHQTKHTTAHCQMISWEKILYLYDLGYQSAKNAHEQLSQILLDASSVVNHQSQTVQNWQQALDLLLDSSFQDPSSNHSQKWEETFRKIQEMYLQDQSQPSTQIEDLHAW